MNQFVDGAVMLVTNPQRVGFLVAEKSYKTKVIGTFCKAIGSIPVARPQDNALKGPGKIYLEGVKLIGVDTKFSSMIHKGDRIRPGKSKESYRVKEVLSDTAAVLAEEFGEASPTSELSFQGSENAGAYEILGFVDQGNVFSSGTY